MKKQRPGHLRINKAALFLAIFSVFFLGYQIIRLIPDKTVILRSENVIISEEATLYTFKEEDYTKITTSSPINIIVEEGTCLSAADVISDNYRLRSKDFIKEKIESVTYMIENTDISTKWEVYEQIILVRDEINLLTEKLLMAQTESETEKINSEIKALKKQEDILQGAVQYVITPLSEMYNIRAKYNSMLDSDTLPLTLYNLNFTVFGNIYFSTDGYEDAMSIVSLESMKEGVFGYVDSFVPAGEQTRDNTYILKSTSKDKTVIAALVPSDTVIPSEAEALELKSDIINRYNTDQSGGYYSYLYDRVDKLVEFPTLSVKSADGDIITGHIVDVLDCGDKKAAVLLLRDDIEKTNNMRIEKGELQTQSFRAYVINSSAVVSHEGKDYIIKLAGGSAKVPVEIIVDRYVDGKAVLRASDNPSLTNKTEILLKGDSYDFR